MELTVTVTNGTTDFRAGILLDGDTSDVAYISQPMLVFGSSIGEGNYSRPPGEIIWFEAQKILDGYNNETLSTGDDGLIYLQAETELKVGAGITAVYFSTFCADSAPADGVGLALGSNSTDIWLRNYLGGSADQRTGAAGWVKTNSDGNVYINSYASGANTLDTWIVAVGIQLR